MQNGRDVYETAYRIPLLVRYPAAVPAGMVVQEVVSTVDFPQTLLGLLGLAPSGRAQGRDASALLRGGRCEWANEAFLHHSEFDFAGIFTDRHELALARCGDHVLFDRVDDTDQIRNLFAELSARGVVEDLAARVIEHNRALGSPAMQWLAMPS